MEPPLPAVTFEEFARIDIRAGTVVRCEAFPEARKPAYKLWIDFGPGIAVACDEEQAQGARPLLPGDPCPDPEIGVVYNHSAGFGTVGGASLVEFAHSSDGGQTWTELKVRPGSTQIIPLGEPAVMYDPISGRWIVTFSAVTNFGTVRWPIMTSIWDGPGNQWSTPMALP